MQLNKITMKNIIKNLSVIIGIFLFSSCCSKVFNEKVDISNSKEVLKNPASLAINKSIVAARVEEILLSGDGNFVVKAYIIKVEEDSSYPNLAIEGKTYDLIPNFQLDDSKKIISDSERNKKLSFLSEQKIGYEFKAIIFFENLNGWFIQEVI